MVLAEPRRLRIWPRIDNPIASELVRLECLRTIDRARVLRGIEDDEVADRRGAILETIEALTLVPLHRRILERAAEPFPTTLGSLDAIHLASALLVRERVDDVAFATHDLELAIAAHAVGFTVHGSPTRA